LRMPAWNPIMAKPAKGSRPSAVDPSPPPNPSGKKKRVERPCLQCGQVKAKHLNILGFNEPIDPVFCSTLCAFVFAITFVTSSPISWCERHNRWTNSLGDCKECVDAREIHKLHAPPTAGQAGVEEVKSNEQQ
jgi:hypothetical protein